MIRRAWRGFLDEPELSIGIVILVMFVFLASLQVITRYLLGQQFIWTEEVSSNLLIWMTFLGAAGVERRYGHIRVELIEDFFSPKTVRIVYGFFDVIILFTLICLIIAGWNNTFEMAFARTPALRIPWRYILLIVPIAASIMTIYTARNIIRRVRGEKVYVNDR